MYNYKKIYFEHKYKLYFVTLFSQNNIEFCFKQLTNDNNA